MIFSVFSCTLFGFRQQKDLLRFRNMEKINDKSSFTVGFEKDSAKQRIMHNLRKNMAQKFCVRGRISETKLQIYYSY